MRFEEALHWPEGLFMQPHHLQQLQINMESRDRINREFFMPFPCGLIDFEQDLEALNNLRVVIKRISALMPSGAEISMPGNAAISSLDLTETLKVHRESFLIYLALPQRSEQDANMADEESRGGKKLFSLHETTVRDENTGDNEIVLVRHRANARLITEFDSRTDMDVLPLMRLIPVYTENSLPKLQLDPEYIPPFAVISGDCPLLNMAVELNIQLKKRSNKLLHDLSEAHCSSEELSGSSLFAVLQLQTLNRYIVSLAFYLQSGKLFPNELYLNLSSLLGELTALRPLREIQPIGDYNHLDCAPQFRLLMQQIRLLILEEGVSGFFRFDFKTPESGSGLIAQLRKTEIEHAGNWYLAIRCAGDPRHTVTEIENGDTFKMINPGGRDMRIRGVKLMELRYPPRFLPALPDTLWFQLKTAESARVWEKINEESAVLLDWGEGMFPELEATLFATTLNKEDKA